MFEDPLLRERGEFIFYIKIKSSASAGCRLPPRAAACLRAAGPGEFIFYIKNKILCLCGCRLPPRAAACLRAVGPGEFIFYIKNKILSFCGLPAAIPRRPCRRRAFRCHQVNGGTFQASIQFSSFRKYRSLPIPRRGVVGEREIR